MLAVAHLGNWEAAGLRAAAERAPVLAVAEGLANERLVQWFVQMRDMMDIDVVIARRGARVTGTLARSGSTRAAWSPCCATVTSRVGGSR